MTGVTVGYGKRPVLHDVSLRVGEGEVVALIGHNGSGKTTTLRTIAGVLKPAPGAIRWQGADITGNAPSDNAVSGIALVPQGRGVFRSLTVHDNLRLGAYVHGRVTQAQLANLLATVVSLFPILGDRLDQPAGSMSGGQQQMVAIGMALMAQPRLLLLDEPSTGLSPVLAQRTLETVKTINEQLGMTVLIVEQNVRQVLRICDRAYVLKLGQIALEAPGQQLLQHSDLWSLF